MNYFQIFLEHFVHVFSVMISKITSSIISIVLNPPRYFLHLFLLNCFYRHQCFAIFSNTLNVGPSAGSEPNASGPYVGHRRGFAFRDLGYLSTLRFYRRYLYTQLHIPFIHCWQCFRRIRSRRCRCCLTRSEPLRSSMGWL